MGFGCYLCCFQVEQFMAHGCCSMMPNVPVLIGPPSDIRIVVVFDGTKMQLTYYISKALFFLTLIF